VWGDDSEQSVIQIEPEHLYRFISSNLRCMKRRARRSGSNAVEIGDAEAFRQTLTVGDPEGKVVGATTPIGR
jgi:hypothetical protein